MVGQTLLPNSQMISHMSSVENLPDIANLVINTKVPEAYNRALAYTMIGGEKIKGLQWFATLDYAKGIDKEGNIQLGEKVCPLCAFFDGMIIDADKLEIIPPTHPNCMCVLQPIGQEETGLKFNFRMPDQELIDKHAPFYGTKYFGQEPAQFIEKTITAGVELSSKIWVSLFWKKVEQELAETPEEAKKRAEREAKAEEEKRQQKVQKWLDTAKEKANKAIEEFRNKAEAESKAKKVVEEEFKQRAITNGDRFYYVPPILSKEIDEKAVNKTAKEIKDGISRVASGLRDYEIKIGNYSDLLEISEETKGILIDYNKLKSVLETGNFQIISQEIIKSQQSVSGEREKEAREKLQDFEKACSFIMKNSGYYQSEPIKKWLPPKEKVVFSEKIILTKEEKEKFKSVAKNTFRYVEKELPKEAEINTYQVEVGSIGDKPSRGRSNRDERTILINHKDFDIMTNKGVNNLVGVLLHEISHWNPKEDAETEKAKDPTIAEKEAGHGEAFWLKFKKTIDIYLLNYEKENLRNEDLRKVLQSMLLEKHQAPASWKTDLTIAERYSLGFINEKIKEVIVSVVLRSHNKHNYLNR